MNINHCKSVIENAISATPLDGHDRRELAAWLSDRSRQVGGDPAVAGKEILRVTINRKIQSQNKQTWAHWSAYGAEKRAWKVLLRAALVPQPEPPNRLIYIQIHSFRNRLCDHANLVGGAKPIPDCLIELNYLRDDTPEWVRIDYFQHRVLSNQQRTEIVFFQPVQKEIIR